jgi:hypothetical protein
LTSGSLYPWSPMAWRNSPSCSTLGPWPCCMRTSPKPKSQLKTRMAGLMRSQRTSDGQLISSRHNIRAGGHKKGDC